MQSITESKNVIKQKIKWFAISFPVFALGCTMIYFIATHRSEFNIDVATGGFFLGAVIAAISLTIWNIKSNEVTEVQENG